MNSSLIFPSLCDKFLNGLKKFFLWIHHKFYQEFIMNFIVNTWKNITIFIKKIITNFGKVWPTIDQTFFHESMKIFFANFPKSFSKFFLINDEFFKNSSQIHDPIETQVNLWIIIQWEIYRKFFHEFMINFSINSW